MRGELRNAMKTQRLDMSDARFTSCANVYPPPPICNRVSTKWKEREKACSCRLWPQWVNAHTYLGKVHPAESVTDANNVCGAIKPGDAVLYFRPGEQNNKWFYSGKVFDCSLVAVPSGQRKSIVGLN